MQKGCLNYIGSGRLSASGFGPAVRQHYILHYCISGSGYCDAGGALHKVCAGETFLILPDYVMNYYPDKLDPWEYIWIDFSGEEAERFLHSSGFSVNTPVCKKLPIDVLSLFEKAHLEGKKRNNHFAKMSALYAVLSAYLEYFPQESQLEKDLSLSMDDIVKYISAKIHLPTLSVESVAKKFNLDRATLYRNFKKSLKLSPSDYITGQRIYLAQKLLENPNVSVKAVACSVGYSDQMYFAKVFKKATGLSPIEYKNTYTKI